MTKERIKENSRNNLLKKRIILFGAGDVAEKFYMQNKDRLNISHCVSNLKEQWGQKCFLNELDVREFKSEEVGPNDYLIVCGTYAFRQIDIQLADCGFHMFEHYIESTIADCLLENKKIVLFRGSCILRDIYQCVITSKTFTERYAAIFATDSNVVSKFDNSTLFYISRICDLYICSYRILQRDNIYLLNEDLPEGCEIISVSNISFPGYWPQADPEIHNSNKYLVHPYNSKRDLVFYHTMYRLEDVNINRLIEEGKEFEEIYDLISSKDFYDEKTVKRNLKVAFKSVQIAEQFADIKVMDFIKENYEHRRVFQNFAHMHKCVTWTFVRRLFEKLDLPYEECDVLEEMSPDYIHHGGDIPIYPSVAQALGLTWYDENMEYEIMTYHGIEKMTFKEYVRHYVEYTKRAKKIMETW